MTLTIGSTELLAAVREAFPQVGLSVLDGQGALVERFGADEGTNVSIVDGKVRVDAGPGRTSLSLPMADGHTVVACMPAAQGGVLTPLLQALIASVSQREQLEQDMESMNTSSLRLLEQVSMLGETLPRLSAIETDDQIAVKGLEACLVAAGVQRAVYLRNHPETNLCEVVSYLEMDGNGQATPRDYPLEDLVPADQGLVGEVLALDDSALLRTTDGRERLGDPGSPENLAQNQVLGVPVSYGAGARRVRLGVLLVMDKSRSGYAAGGQLGSEEGQVVLSFAAVLGAVLGARKTAELGKELSMAQAIQAQILPDRPVRIAGFELAADYTTCGDVGGDYYDYVQLADGRTMVVIADVSGHNLASGMMMVSARATLRTLAGVRSDPAQLFDDLAAAMYQDLTHTERFITAAAAILRAGDNVVELVNAGHNDLMHYRAAERRVDRIKSESTILGFLPRPTYRCQTVAMQPGDFLFLYTDGVTETQDGSGEMFGEERLAAVLEGTADRSAHEVVATVLAAVSQFRGVQVRGDDVTCVAIRAVPQPGGRS